MKIRNPSLILSIFLCLSLFGGGTAAQSYVPTPFDNAIFFDYESIIVKPKYEDAIKAHAEFLIANPKAKVSIEGHTEARGGHEYNLSLAQKRTKAVTILLLRLNVSESQFEAVSFGSTKPAAEGDDEAAFEKNRRVEFFYR